MRLLQTPTATRDKPPKWFNPEFPRAFPMHYGAPGMPAHGSRASIKCATGAPIATPLFQQPLCPH
jgi:hypothetical protein